MEKLNMKQLKRWLLCAFLMALSLPVFAEGVEWFTDVPTAMDKARRENKIVMLDFTGSDWCGWCQRLKREVFDQPEFVAFAQENLVMVEVDFPHNKPQNPEQQSANRELAERYHIEGFPTLIYLNAVGQQVAIGGYIAGGPKNFIARTEQIPGIRHAAGTPGRGNQEANDPPRPPPAFVPITPSTPTLYTELALKGISGTKDRRMALINNETLMAGETAKIKVLNKRVEVCCKEIRDDSVLVTIDGKPAELKLGQHQR